MADARVLVVDDEQSMRDLLAIMLRQTGYEVAVADGGETAIERLKAETFDLVVTDLRMRKIDGLTVLKAAKEHSPRTVVLVVTAYASTETAVEAMKLGAYDYVTKPFKVDEIKLVIQKALEKKVLSTENARLRSELRSERRERQLVGNSTAMQQVYEMIGRIAATKTNVLIVGESGTGKELVARAIHTESDRAEMPFVALNCAAIPENLLESELFGHVKGAFTGAVNNKPGLFEAADNGTLFLDEVGELSLPLQVKLLRAIQEKTIRRVGGTSDRRVDVRIVAATNRRLEDEVAANRFREDLYYRLNVIQLELPPLRDRMEDLPLLVHHFVEKFARELAKPVRGLSEEAMARLRAHPWPGNVRELENGIERAVALSRSEWIEAEALPPALGQANDDRPAAANLPEGRVDLDNLVADYERGLLLHALTRAGGVKKRAAHFLGISFRSFRYRLEKLGLDDGSGRDE
jgi:two-component system, NtrC family, response regulator PilR